MNVSIIATLSTVVCAMPAAAAIITVGPGGTSGGFQFGQVTDAITAATSGDLIHVVGRTENGPRFAYDAFDLGLAASGVEMSWGFSPGVIEVGGNMRVGPNANLRFELGGTNNAQVLTSGRVDYDTVLVNGSFQLDGMMSLSLIDGFAPSIGHTFELVSTTGTVNWTGDFVLHFNAPAMPAGLSWQFTVGSGIMGGQSIYASVVPAPGAITLVGAAGLVGSRRRR
jgi:hypothetical protein